MKNILITGGGGFIGKNLIKHLITDSNIHNIIVVDNFITSNQLDFTSFINNQSLSNKVILYIYDITTNLKFIIEDLKFKNINTIDEIYHLASLASPIFYKENPIETLDVGYIGTKNILELAKKYKSKVLFSSTSEVYGDAEISPQHENYYGNVNSFGARSCYDESKRVAEALCYTYINEYNIDIKIARIFNTYGPHMMLNDGRIITECIRHLMNDTTLTIFGDGNQTRSCCYIDDNIVQLIKLMDSNYNIPINIGNNIELSINDTVKIIEKVWKDIHNIPINKNVAKIQYMPLTQNDPLQRKPCLKLNKIALGNTDYTSFEYGVRQTIYYFLNKNTNQC
jgi:UDP-glucuronate decarboxylase